MLEGFVMWLNFNDFWTNEMFLYYPIILVGITTLVLLFPAPIFYYRTREWFLYSHVRPQPLLLVWNGNDKTLSFASYLLVFTRWNFVISSLEICSAP